MKIHGNAMHGNAMEDVNILSVYFAELNLFNNNLGYMMVKMLLVF